MGKMTFGGFASAWLALSSWSESGRVGKQSRDYLPEFAAFNGQSTRHRARPGPTLAPWYTGGPLRAPQPRAQELTRGRKRKVLFS